MAKKKQKPNDQATQVALDANGNPVESFDVADHEDTPVKNKKGFKKEKGKFKVIHLNAPTESQQDAEAKQDLYSIVRINNSITITRRIFAIVMVALFLFVAGSYLIYYYTDIADFEMTTITHVHKYNELGTTWNGDCHHLGYVQYLCSVPGCNSDRMVYNTELGNHQFDEAHVTLVTENGTTYKIYHCTVQYEDESGNLVNCDFSKRTVAADDSVGNS